MTMIDETETATGITRKRCRNPRCRMKLPTPVDNHHHAFCTRGCYESFFDRSWNSRDVRRWGRTPLKQSHWMLLRSER
jgi:hypothetical protein